MKDRPACPDAPGMACHPAAVPAAPLRPEAALARSCGRGAMRLFQALAVLVALRFALGLRPAAAEAGNPACSGGGNIVPVRMLTQIAVLHRAQVGQAITPWVPTAKTNFYSCTLGSGGHLATGIGFQLMTAMTRSGLMVTRSDGLTYTVWDTGIPGIGIAIGVFAAVDARCGAGTWRDLGTPGGAFPAPWVGDACAVPGTGATSTQNGGMIEAALVKTGPIRSTHFGGATIQAASMEQTASGPFQEGTTSQRVSFAIPPIDIVAPTCSTFAPDVTLPTVSTTAFRAAGALAGLTRFAITLVCPSFDPVNVFMTLTDSVAPDNRSADLTLTPASTAGGLAIRIRRGGTDVHFGAESDAVGNANQFAITTVDSDGAYLDVPFTASYVRPDATPVTPGTVHAAAIYTMAYQ